MKLKKLYVSVLALLCFCCFTGVGVVFALENSTPEYTKVTVPEGNVTASSVYGSPEGEMLTWELSKLVNSGRGDWMAQWGYTSNPSADEWINIDLGATKTVGKIVVHNEQKKAYARNFVVFGSKDNSSWYELARYEDGDTDWEDDQTVELEFSAAEARYIKLNVREKGLDGANYLVAMSNIEVFETNQPVQEQPRAYTEIEAGITADQTLDGASVESLWDGITADQTSKAPYWCGGWKNAAQTDTDELIFDAGEVISFGGITLFPRCATASADPCSVYGFPKDFTISYSVDGESFTLVSGQEYKDYQPNLSWNEFFFIKPVEARYIKFSITERGLAGESYLTQLAEAKAYRADFEVTSEYTLVSPKEVTASGAWDSNTAEKASDGDLSTAWVAPWGYSTHKYANEFISYDLGENKLIGKIDFFVADVNIPAAFRVLVSENGVDWGVLFRQDAPQYKESCCSVTFDSVSARYVKVEVFEKGVNGANWLAGFTEIKVYAVNDEIPMGKVEYLQDIGEEISNIYVSSTTDPNTKDKLNDGITANVNAVSNYWMAGISAEQTVDGSNSEIGFDGFVLSFDETTQIDALWLFPRFDGAPGASIGFPVDFTVMYSMNGQEWYKIGSYTDYKVLSGWNEFVFSGTVTAKHIGVYVQKRGNDGELFSIEIAEAKLFRAVQPREEMQGELVLDTSKIEVIPYEPSDFIYTYTEFRLNLSEHFKYSLGGALNFEVVSGGGKIEEKDGQSFYVLTPETKGEIDVKIRAVAAGKDSPAAELSFKLTVTTKEDPDVIVKPYQPGLDYAVGVKFRIDLSTLFVYEGTEKLVYTTDKGTIETVGDKTYLVFTPDQAGDIQINVSAMPEGKQDKKVDNVLTLKVVDAPAPSPEQPPVYGPAQTGCGASVYSGAALISFIAAGVVAILIGRKRRV